MPVSNNDTKVAEPQQEIHLSIAPQPISYAQKLGLLTAAIVAITVFARPGLGMAVTLAAGLLATAMVLQANVSTRRWCLAALVLTPWLVVRDNSWLAISIVCTVLLVLGLSLLAGATNRSIWDLPLRSVFAREKPAASRVVHIGDGHGSPLVSCVVGAILAMPVVGTFYLLLASADEVFASVVDFSSLPVGRFVLFFLAAPVTMLLLSFAANGRHGTTPTVAQRFGAVESSIVLGALSALFAAFIVIRFATIGRSLDDLGLRDEVRSGFFQLLWVAALTVVLILAIREVNGGRVMDAKVRYLGLLTIALAGVIDGLALYRIAQYVDQSFLTQLRFWSFGFGLWLLVPLALAALRLVGYRATSVWFTGAMVTSWMVFLFVFAVVNPDARIAEHNFANPPTGEDEWISVIPLIELSEDATPIIIDNVEVLRPMPNNRYDRVVDHLCATEPDNYPRGFNVSRSTASTAASTLCNFD